MVWLRERHRSLTGELGKQKKGVPRAALQQFFPADGIAGGRKRPAIGDRDLLPTETIVATSRQLVTVWLRVVQLQQRAHDLAQVGIIFGN